MLKFLIRNLDSILKHFHSSVTGQREAKRSRQHSKIAELAAEKIMNMEKITQWLHLSNLSLNTGKFKGVFFVETNVQPLNMDILCK